MKSLIQLMLSALLMFGLSACGPRQGKDVVDAGPDKPVAAKEISAKGAKLANGLPARVFEMECEGKKSLLVIIGEVQNTIDLSNSSKLIIDGGPVKFNPVRDAIEVGVYQAGLGDMVMPVQGATVEAARAKCTGSTISFPELDAMYPRKK